MAPSRRVTRQLPSMEALARIQPHLPKDIDIWLVGGSVRDQLIGRESRDYDLVVAGEARPTARRVANGLQADYYDLDRQRDAGRVLVRDADGRLRTIDFTPLNPGGIGVDLAKRDFTINALAIQLRTPSRVIDVTGGMQDLERGIVRACSSTSIADDPVRALRGVRLAHQLGYEIDQDTLGQIQRGAPHLRDTTAERMRDELFRILALPSSGTAVRHCLGLGLLFEILPELAPLQGQLQPSPHAFDVLEHSLRVAHQLGLWVGDAGHSEGLWGQLEPYSGRIQQHLAEEVALGRSRAQLLVLGALLHDIGKPASAAESDLGVPHFHGHEAVGAEMAVRRAEALRLSRSEASALGRVVANHMRPGQLAREHSLTGRAIYRFFRSTGDEGLEICLLAMADLLGQTEPPPESARWDGRLHVVRRLLQAYFDRRQQEVAPRPLVSGEDLMRELDLKEGPLVGELLEAIRQEQADGGVTSPEQALAFANWLRHQASGPPGG